MSPPFTVLLADDHAPLRALLRVVLEGPSLHVVAEAGDADEAVEQAQRHHPDLCLLDLQMPAGGGLYALRQITRSSPQTACVLLTSAQDDDILLAAAKLGARGFLPKDMDLDRLPDALLGVLRGEAALPRGRVPVLLDELRRAEVAARAREGRRTVDVSEEEWVVLQDLRVRALQGRGPRRSPSGRRWGGSTQI